MKQLPDRTYLLLYAQKFHFAGVPIIRRACGGEPQALDAIRENGPGQHFLGTAHTLANFENAFYRSTTADNASYEQWLEDGGLDAAQRANTLWKSRLAEYQPPPIDSAVDEELRAFVGRRKSEMPDEIG